MPEQFTYGFSHFLFFIGVHADYVGKEENTLQQFLYLMIAEGVPLLCL